MCRTTWTAAANWLCSAARDRPPVAASASSRAGTSRAELACRVPAPPSCPVFIADEQVAHLGAAHLTHDQAVRPHPQGMADQVAQWHPARALDVRRAGDEPDDVRVPRT